MIDKSQSFIVADFVNWPLWEKSWPEIAETCLNEKTTNNFDYYVWPGGGPGLVFTLACVEEYLRRIAILQAENSAILSVAPHDVWLHKIYAYPSNFPITRIHCPGFHQYGSDELLLQGLDALPRLISVHLNHKLDQMLELHKLNCQHFHSPHQILPISHDQGYKFTNDWFEVAALRDGYWHTLVPEESPSKILEIGSYEGASASHLIANNFWSDHLHIWCVDTWEGGAEHKREGINMSAIEDRFNHNTSLAIRRSRNNASITKLKGRSDHWLPRLLVDGHSESFDFVYIDGSHAAADVLSDAILSFKLCRVGGIIIFDDYLWPESFETTGNPVDFPRLGVDAFTQAFFGRIRILKAPLYQLYMRKISS